MPPSRSATKSFNYSALIAATAIVICATTLEHAAARLEYVEMIPNGANVPGVAALGHTTDVGGVANTQFGKDFATAGHKWTKEFCKQDSDGDGQHNGAELGDPCCEWVLKTNQKVEWIDGVSSLADAAKMSDPTLWVKINCMATTTTDASTETPATTSKVPTPAPASSSALPVNGAAELFVTVVLAVGAAFALVQGLLSVPIRFFPSHLSSYESEERQKSHH